jgi:aspartyl-tRNA(Asn)/glutamyl-tRNA(Gln) amidotransferase subunit A
MLRSFKEIKEALHKGELSLPQLVENYLGQIEKNKYLNMYVEVWAEESLTRAKELQVAFDRDKTSVGSLFGMVVSIKDVICYKDHTVTAGSKILSGFKSLYSSTAVSRLLAEDAILIGSTNCDEFAMGSTNETSYYGVVRNAVNTDLVPGGSSGGAAVSVQTDTCLVALGSDTGGSVRQPAAFCGINGFKPTYGRISRHGLLAYGSSFDQIGIFAHNIKDIATTLSIIAGPDEYDSTALTSTPEKYENHLTAPKKAKIAYFRAALEHPSLDKTVRERCESMIENLKSKGHSVEGVDFEYLDFMIPAYYVLTTAEASSNLSRYDGIRFGYRSTNATNLEETYKLSRTEGFGREVKRRILLGTFVLSSGYYDAFYGKAQRVRRLIIEKTEEIFNHFDFILMPTAPGPAWPIGESLDDPIAMYLADIFTVHANLTGIPAISIPVQPTEEGLPLGIQFFANKERESSLLGFVDSL